MRSFLARHKEDWEELEALVAKAGRRGKSLTFAERQRLDDLYRRTTVHLARVASRTGDEQLVSYLNNLAAAAHSVIYLPPRGSIFQRLWTFVVEGFGRAIARTWRPQLLSATLLI